MQEKVRYRCQFWGSVQGVGFRYYAQHSAEYLGLTGWVENLYDGSVLAEVLWNRFVIYDFIEMLSVGRYIEIDHMENVKIPLKEEENSFRILR